MAPSEIRGPDLAGVVSDANKAGLEHVVIGGFAVIAHGYLRATKDSDLLVPDGSEADEAIMRFFDLIGATRFGDDKTLTREDVVDAQHVRVDSRHGAIDILRGGRPRAAQHRRLQAARRPGSGSRRSRKARRYERRAAHRPDPGPRYLIRFPHHLSLSSIARS